VKHVLTFQQGEGAPPHMKGTCVNHLRHVQAMFKGAHITYNARTEEEVDEELISEKVARSSASTYSFVDRSQVTSEPNHPVVSHFITQSYLGYDKIPQSDSDSPTQNLDVVFTNLIY
jgi:hypothetical protein